MKGKLGKEKERKGRGIEREGRKEAKVESDVAEMNGK